MHDLATARAPRAPLRTGLYESHYLTATDPAGGRALWVRHTVLKRPGEPGRPTTWMVWFDRAAGAPTCHRVTDAAQTAGPGQYGAVWSRSALGWIAPTAAAGAIEGAAWNLSWEPLAAELPYLPARWLYDRPIPRSNGAALIPFAAVSGSFQAAGAAAVALERWDGMIGHNWGTEHAERWSWLHAGGLGEDGTGWLDLVLVRVRVGPLLTPWIASGALRLDGRTRTPSRRGRVVRELDSHRARIGVPLQGGGELALQIVSPPQSTAHWDYASPRGPGRTVENCSVADATVRLDTGSERRVLEVHGRFAAEHGAPAP